MGKRFLLRYKINLFKYTFRWAFLAEKNACLESLGELAITGLQLVKFLSTHKHVQKSHSFATFAKFRCILSSSFSSTLGESKFCVHVIAMGIGCRASYFHPCSDKTKHPESSLIVELFCPFQCLTERHRRVHRRHERGYAAAADIHCIFSQRT